MAILAFTVKPIHVATESVARVAQHDNVNSSPTLLTDVIINKSPHPKDQGHLFLPNLPLQIELLHHPAK